MAMIAQPSLFGWDQVDDLGDLERLVLVIHHMPDELLIKILHEERANGRDDYPIVAMWNSIIAGIIFQHPSIESLRRELMRNAQLRELCGFEPLKGAKGVPSKSAYSRFLAKLLKHTDQIDKMFNTLVDELEKLLPGFGKEVAFDGKAIHSFAKGKKQEDDAKQSEADATPDRRKEDDANWGKKTYRGTKEDGTAWEKIVSWFGFRLHLIVDAKYELPLAFEVTQASKGEQPVIRALFDELAKNHPELVEECEYGMGDRGYDSHETISHLWKKYHIKPVIDLRNMWRDGEKTKILKDSKYTNIVYNYCGEVFCHCPKTGVKTKMAFCGFEEDREALKYACPAKHYGFECPGASKCSARKGVRISLSEDERVFTPVARSSHKWKRLYKKRTSVERVNSRIEGAYGFEKHYIRGLGKMKLRCGLSLCVMLAIAVGHIKAKNSKLIRSLVKAA